MPGSRRDLHGGPPFAGVGRPGRGTWRSGGPGPPGRLRHRAALLRCCRPVSTQLRPYKRCSRAGSRWTNGPATATRQPSRGAGPTGQRHRGRGPGPRRQRTRGADRPARPGARRGSRAEREELGQAIRPPAQEQCRRNSMVGPLGRHCRLPGPLASHRAGHPRGRGRQ